MKTAKDLKKEVDKALAEKANELLRAFQAQRDKDLETLVSLSEQLHDLEVKLTIARSTQEKAAKQFIPDNKTLNECGQKIFHLGKNMAGLEKQIDALFKKLTNFPESIKEIYPFMKLIQD